VKGPRAEALARRQASLPRRSSQFLPATSDPLSRWRLIANSGNDYEIDREYQKSGLSYTGLANVPLEDQAVTESMGAIYERDHEHLGTSDAMIIRTRRRLINAAKALAERGTVPPGVDEPEVYYTRSGGVILPRTADWQQATERLRHPERIVTRQTSA
jgi:hypothetical protein